MASVGSDKKKHNFLTIEKKLEILEKMSKGESGASLARTYGVGTSTISDLKRKKSTLLEYASKLDSQQGSKQRKTLRTASNSALEDAMYVWFIQRRCLGKPLSGPLVCEKALQFNEKLGGPADFKASSGWLKNFKLRHGIRELEVQGKKLSSDLNAAQTYKMKFSAMVANKGYSKDDVYNADETGVNWRALPRKSLACRREQLAPGYKDRVTVMVCSNASGTHSLQLMVIGKSKKPRCFKNVNCLPVCYKSQKNCWMTADIFTDWYVNEFIPSVKKHREVEGKTGKVLLIIDNAPTHPPVETLNAIDDDFQVQFLPLNVTALLQPMDQGIIEKMKMVYRKRLLRRLLLEQQDDESVVAFTKKLDLKHCVDILAGAWDSLTQRNLENGWRKLWLKEEEGEENHPEEEQVLEEVTMLFHSIPGFENCDKNDAIEWLEIDKNDLGYQILNDEEIVNVVTDIETSTDDDDAKEVDNEEFVGPTHSDAFNALETAMSWLEKQTECTTTQLACLRGIRDLAAKKRSTNVVQKTIKYFFRK